MFFNHFRSCRNVLKCWSSVFIRQTGLSDRLLMADFAKYFPWKDWCALHDSNVRPPGS